MKYGTQSKRWLGILTRKTIEYADLLLPLHGSLVKGGYGPVDVQRLLEWVHPRGKISIIHEGFDTESITPPPSDRKRNGVICVAYVLRRLILKVKGIDRLINAAANLPHVFFVQIGISSHLIPENYPPNLLFLGPKKGTQLYESFRGAQVVALLSRTEGMPASLAEGMLSGCVPVATKAGAMPDMVGRSGEIVDGNDPRDIIRGLANAIQKYEKNWRMARSHIVRCYPQRRRKTRLKMELRKLLD